MGIIVTVLIEATSSVYWSTPEEIKLVHKKILLGNKGSTVLR